MIHETVRRMINTLIVDLTEESSRRIAVAAPASIDDVRKAGPLIAFSASLRAEADELKRFLRRQPLPALPRHAHDDQGAPHRPRAVCRV